MFAEFRVRGLNTTFSNAFRSGLLELMGKEEGWASPDHVQPMYAEVATRISCTLPLPATSCAAFCADSCMQCIEATDLHRKSGGTLGTRPEPALSEVEGGEHCGKPGERWFDEQKNIGPVRADVRCGQAARTPQREAHRPCRILRYSISMPLKTVTFRLTEKKLEELDSVAEVQQRDRSFIINEAVNQYLSRHEYHRTLIEEGIRQDDVGAVIEHEMLMTKAAGWAKNKQI